MIMGGGGGEMITINPHADLVQRLCTCMVRVNQACLLTLGFTESHRVTALVICTVIMSPSFGGGVVFSVNSFNATYVCRHVCYIMCSSWGLVFIFVHSCAWFTHYLKGQCLPYVGSFSSQAGQQHLHDSDAPVMIWSVELLYVFCVWWFT